MPMSGVSARAMRAPIEGRSSRRLCMTFSLVCAAPPCRGTDREGGVVAVGFVSVMAAGHSTSGCGRDVAQQGRGHGARIFPRDVDVDDADRAGALASDRLADGALERSDAAHRTEPDRALA